MQGRVLTSDGRARPGVLVSDGRTVTATAHDGTFSLRPEGRFVFVTRPAGFRADRWFVPADADDVTFVLTPEPDPFPYRFVHVSDLHVSDPELNRAVYPQPVEMGSAEALTEFLSAVPHRAGDVSSVIATGDLTDFGSDGEFDALRKAVDSSPLPVHLLPGNHDHLAGSTAFEMSVTRTGYVMHGADPTGYERNLGPRWYSFDLAGGLHVVALDWHTHELGIDHEEQNAWLRADLESVPAGTPWILLSHDQPWHSILDGLPRRPLATFSGHRHTSRVVEVDGTLHVNTPTPLFASLDYAPPSFRVVTWDGDRIGLQTRAVAPTGLERATFEVPGIPRPLPAAARWRHQLSGAGHRAPARVDGDEVFLGVKHEDTASGAVEALSLVDGTRRWLAELGSSVKGTPAVTADAVYAVEVVGDVVCLDRATGAQRWRVASPDPLRLFAYTDPVVAQGLVIVGDLSHLRALDAETGALRWDRLDLAPYQTLVGHATPLVVGDTLVVGSCPVPLSLMGLDLHTGETRWPTAEATGRPVLQGDTPVGTALHDEVGDAFYLPTPGRTVKVDPTGRTVWSAPTSLPFNPATPVATPHGVAVADAGHAIVLLDREDGHELWRTPITTASPFPMASYTRTPHPVFAPPTLSDDLLLVPGLDGALHVLDARTGEHLREVPLGVPVAASLTLAGDVAIAVDVDGGVTAIDLGAVR
ncbi:PQQ-binding-like beta-propeller repeat protein [Actinosynnema sp. NPDC020468]|uniref:outer membrane protein assembly factor BamB family protein n=1 Tax=Actinosynnema sp. NPDC020468 TaxID=3154488 RepID=UPI003404E096